MMLMKHKKIRKTRKLKTLKSEAVAPEYKTKAPVPQKSAIEVSLDVLVSIRDTIENSANELTIQRHRMQTVLDLLGKVRIVDAKREPEQLPYVR